MRVRGAQWEGDIPSGKAAMWILVGKVDAAVKKLFCVDFFCSHACPFPSFFFGKELLTSRFFSPKSCCDLWSIILFLWTHNVKELIFLMFVSKKLGDKCDQFVKAVAWRGRCYDLVKAVGAIACLVHSGLSPGLDLLQDLH